MGTVRGRDALKETCALDTHRSACTARDKPIRPPPPKTPSQWPRPTAGICTLRPLRRMTMHTATSHPPTPGPIVSPMVPTPRRHFSTITRLPWTTRNSIPDRYNIRRRTPTPPNSLWRRTPTTLIPHRGRMHHSSSSINNGRQRRLLLPQRTTRQRNSMLRPTPLTPRSPCLRHSIYPRRPPRTSSSRLPTRHMARSTAAVSGQAAHHRQRTTLSARRTRRSLEAMYLPPMKHRGPRTIHPGRAMRHRDRPTRPHAHSTRLREGSRRRGGLPRRTTLRGSTTAHGRHTNRQGNGRHTGRRTRR